jgi:hypothetical protein
MPLFEVPPEKGPAGEFPLAQQHEKVAPEAREREYSAREKQRVLTHLIESGRAKTPEEAEEYLASLNQLKEKLLQFACGLTVKQVRQRNSFPDEGLVLYAGKRAEEANLKEMTVGRINREDPNIWNLDRTSYSTYPLGGYSFTERMFVKMIGGQVEIVFESHGNTAEKLKNHLSEEALDLLRREYGFALKDLAKELRRLADAADKQQGTTDQSALRPLFPKEGKS